MMGLWNYICLASSILVVAVTCHAPAVIQQDYDYVIVGSGPGGGPLAANLAREGFSVLLMEAGDDRGDELLQQVPGLADVNAENATMSWQFFVSHYQNDTQARRDRAFTYRLINGTLWHGVDPPLDAEPLGIYYPRGATVGGSAISNAANVVLPPDSVWNHIAALTDDESWTPERMRTNFIEFERNTYTSGDVLEHGYEGYISTNRNNISYIVERTGVMDVVRNAISQTEGLSNISTDDVVQLMERDLNRAAPDRYSVEGLYQTPLHIDERRRRSSPWNYIRATLDAVTETGAPRYPLTLSTNTLATRVEFDDSGARPIARAVRYLRGTALYSADRRYDANATGEEGVVRARHEVILSGGTFNTPQLLKLSGIGPAAELESHGIPVLVDLPSVGLYLQDNYEAGINIRAQVPWDNSPFAVCDPEADIDPCMQQWQQGYGPYGEGAAPIFMLLRSSQSEDEDADLIIFGAAGAVFDGHYPGYSQVQWPPTSFFWSVVKMQSRNYAGSVQLRSSDPRDTPIINLNFFEKGRQQDIQALAEGLQHVIGIMNETGGPYQPFEVIDPPADRSLEQHILDHAWSHHVTSSCRMGPINNTDYCVDSRFRVNGVDGLRVVDGSVFPRVPGGFPVGATFAIGQKAYHSIVEDRLERTES